jgi:hypothetical protein
MTSPEAPDGPEIVVVVDEARRVLEQLGPDKAGGVANLLREIVAQGRDSRVVLVDDRDPARFLQYATIQQVGGSAEVRVQRTMAVLDRWRDVRERITMPGHYLAAFYDQVADATGGDGRDAARGKVPDDRAHAGAGIACDVCAGPCLVDDADNAEREARAQIEEMLETAGRHGLTAAEITTKLGPGLVDRLEVEVVGLLTIMYAEDLILAGGLPIHAAVVLQATGVQCRDCEGSGRNCGPHRTYEQRQRDGW